MYRVYDTKEKEWIKQNVYIAQNEDIFISQKEIFKYVKLSLVLGCRYVFQNSIDINDKENRLIFEGDICEFMNGQIGVVIYIADYASYLLFDFHNKKYYTLNKLFCNKNLKVIGNQFDTPDIISEV